MHVHAQALHASLSGSKSGQSWEKLRTGTFWWYFCIYGHSKQATHPKVFTRWLSLRILYQERTENASKGAHMQQAFVAAQSSKKMLGVVSRKEKLKAQLSKTRGELGEVTSSAIIQIRARYADTFDQSLTGQHAGNITKFIKFDKGKKRLHDVLFFSVDRSH